MFAMEKVLEYVTEPPQEKDLDLPKAPENWPTQGSITIKDLSLRYRPELPNVLKDLDINIKGHEKVGIVGRTGSGKSTFTLGLLRIIEPWNVQENKTEKEGDMNKKTQNEEKNKCRIVIDGVDIEEIGLHQLRKKIAIIPQDPGILYTNKLANSF